MPDAKADKTISPAEKKPILLIEYEAYKKYSDYIRLCDEELGVFGYVVLKEDEDVPTFYVDDLFIAPQEVTPTAVDYETEGFAYAIQKAANENRLDELRFSAHSHVNMGAFWSGTDESFIREMNNGQVPWHVSLVQNKKGEHKARVDFFQFQDPLLNQVVKQIPVELELWINNQPDNEDEVRKAELKEFVKKRTYTPSKGTKQLGKGKGKSKGKERGPDRTDTVSLDGDYEAWATKTGTYIPDFINAPPNYKDWKWHAELGWVQTRGKDITALYDGFDAFPLIVINQAEECLVVNPNDWKDGGVPDNWPTDPPDDDDPINARTDKVDSHLSDTDKEDDANMDRLVEAVMERNQA